MNVNPTINQDRLGWLALLLPVAAFGLAALVPIPLLSVGWDAAAMLFWMLGLIALHASVILAIILAVRSWRDRPSRRNRALGGLVVGLLLSAFCVLALMKLNRESAALERRLEQRKEVESP
jgi:Na+/proline symporter